MLLGQNNLFGYNKVDGRLEIVEPEAAVVREVFERYAAGDLGLRAIANDLDSRGVRGRQGKPLTYSTLYGMIRNRNTRAAMPVGGTPRATTATNAATA